MASDPMDALARLRNADVEWDGTLVGVVPRVAGAAAQELLAAPPDWPGLVDAVGDASKFAAAHVLLTLMSGVEHSGPTWNGLAVHLSPGGGVDLDGGQRHALHRRWQAWLAASPRPRRLPD